MSKLSSDLRPASFRKIPFQVETTNLSAGRRTQIHEYPQRDKPWVEDLGRATRELSFDAFVIGADYVEQANRLLGALEQNGPGKLIHPWFGELSVSLQGKASVAFDTSLGYAQFKLSFVEAGELSFPIAATSTPAQSRIAASHLKTAATANFANNFKVDAQPDFVTDEAAKTIAKVTTPTTPGTEIIHLAGVSAWLKANRLGSLTTKPVYAELEGHLSRVSKAKETLMLFIKDPSALGEQILNEHAKTFNLDLKTNKGRWNALAYNIIKYGIQRVQTDLKQLEAEQTATTNTSEPSPSVPVNSNVTPARLQVQANKAALQTLMRQGLLAQAVDTSSRIDTTEYEAAITLRNSLSAALDAEAQIASDTCYAALNAARNAVWQDLTERARNSARLTTYTPADTLPALVLAYDYYTDTKRADEIVERNHLRHPGFVPAAPMRMLTR